MFSHNIERAIVAAPRHRLAEISAAVWRSYAAGAVAEDEAQRLAELIEARKVIALERQSSMTLKRRCGSRPRSSASIERRRAWTGSGWMPPAIAARFTMGEAAAMAVILAEVALHGRCELSHGAVGGRSGVSVSTVKRAMAQARVLGLISIEERRVSWCRNLPNVVTVLSIELAAWLRTRGRGLRYMKGGGVQLGTTPKQSKILSPAQPIAAAWKAGLSVGEVARSGPIRPA